MNEINTIVRGIETSYRADVYLFSAEVNDNTADSLIKTIRFRSEKAENCVLILTTYGGDPDAGFRIVRAIKRYYKKFILYVFGTCKSTGTLIALGADEIVMGDFGEFGPLDIQLTKDDELSNTSGLSYLQSLSTLNDQTLKFYDKNFMAIKQRSGFTITTKTAAEIASKLSIGLMSPISAQIDPVKLGEVLRAISIAEQYGKRLCNNNKAVARLMSDYPSHGFVIDFEEAKLIFPNVRMMDENELKIEEVLDSVVRREPNKPIIVDITENVANEEAQEKAQKEAEEEAAAVAEAAAIVANEQANTDKELKELVNQEEEVNSHHNGHDTGSAISQ